EAGAWPFAIGFAAATALLHAAGVLFGIGLGGRYVAARTVGALTAAGGLWLAFAG
ncbi:MAG: HupE/UreJ family protein, partial [Rhizobiaceae bacterium]|nr:HupE/UreJ family protein [Rhizobiaceae bacterium]